MRSWIITLAVLGVACHVRAPGGLGVTLAARTNIRADVHVQAAAETIVPMQGAPVAEFFGIPLDGAQDVVFVLDCSGSMSTTAQGRLAQAAPAQRKIDVAQSELVEALERLPAGTRMNVIFFNSELEAFAPAIVALDDASRDQLIGFVRETAPAGATALAPALRTAFVMNARRVVLLSDGLGNIGGGPEAVLRDAREAMHGGVRIDTIGLGAGQDGPLLQALASESGGLYQAL